VLRVLAPQIDEKGHTIVRKLPDNLPTITADRTLIGRALKNVISNAIEYTQDLGKIIIDAEVTRGTELHIKIIDNGIGIPPDAHEKIFEKFYRVPGVRERSPGGFGLGLAITKYIIERHNGKIWVESTPGVGSAFHILLPIS
jgi:signal transduction histidine kinase